MLIRGHQSQGDAVIARGSTSSATPWKHDLCTPYLPAVSIPFLHAAWLPKANTCRALCPSPRALCPAGWVPATITPSQLIVDPLHPFPSPCPSHPPCIQNQRQQQPHNRGRNSPVTQVLCPPARAPWPKLDGRR